MHSDIADIRKRKRVIISGMAINSGGKRLFSDIMNKRNNSDKTAGWPSR